ncbi:SMP-30/gluconolactonase/LRE family protein [Paremcibacter congregatus]|uniref:SMP-30/gluconolactonase/LRE family protein n=1 Tax=Paremcibacter congregatus TaxID=2043170 RepID=UPI003A915B74
MRLSIFLLSFWLSLSGAFAQSIGDLWREAGTAYNHKDYPQFITKMRKIEQIRPYQLAAKKNIIRGYSLSGQIEKAFHHIDLVVRQGGYIDLSGKDFEALHAFPEFKSATTELDENNSADGKSDVASSVSETGLLPESIAIDARNNTLYIGSVRRGKILKVSPDGNVTTFAEPTVENGLLGVFGLKIDSVRRHLWAASNDIEQHIGINKGNSDKAGLFQFDLDTGRLINSYFIASEAPALLGDLVMSPEGDIYATDSYNPVIYKLDRVSGQLLPFHTSDRFINLQGICTDGAQLYVADYHAGIFVLDMSTGNLAKISHDKAVNIGGIDGLYCGDGNLVAIQNGFTPHRIIKLDLSEGHIKKLQVLQKNLPAWREPTLGVLHGSMFHYVATSQWGAYDQQGKVTEGSILAPVIIMQVQLK